MECESCSIEKTKLERLEEIFGRTIRSKSELSKVYRVWALKNHPDKFPGSQKAQASKSFQEVVRLLN